MSVSSSVYMSICLLISVGLSVNQIVGQFVNLSVNLFVGQFVNLSVNLFVGQFVNLSVNLSVYLSKSVNHVNLFMCQSIR